MIFSQGWTHGNQEDYVALVQFESVVTQWDSVVSTSMVLQRCLYDIILCVPAVDNSFYHYRRSIFADSPERQDADTWTQE